MTAGYREIGLELLQTSQPHAALPFFDAAGEWALAAFCQYALGHYEHAITLYKRAPPSEENHNGVAGILSTQGKNIEALEYLLANCPEPWSFATQTSLAFLRLGLGHWDLGWKLFRRIHPAGMKLVGSLDEIRGQNVLLCAEHGNGDFIQGFRWAPLLADLAAEVRVWAPPPLRRLARVQAGAWLMAGDRDAHALVGAGWKTVPALDCPYLFGTTPQTIPKISGYLRVPAEMASLRKLPSSGGKFRVGVAWQGAQRLHDPAWIYADTRRSIPFGLMAPMFALSETWPIEFVSLQMSDHHRDHPHLARVLCDSFDYLDTAAIVDQLDLVVSVDTSVAHLAGALGKPVWLLNRFDSCWRWGWSQEFVWYETLRQFRQITPDGWPAVIAEVVASLRAINSASATYACGQRRSKVQH